MSKTKYFCPNCGAATSADDRFCPDCGKALVEDINPPTSIQQSQDPYISAKGPYAQAKHVSDTSEIQKTEYLRLKPQYIDRCVALLIDGIIYSI